MKRIVLTCSLLTFSIYVMGVSPSPALTPSADVEIDELLRTVGPVERVMVERQKGSPPKSIPLMSASFDANGNMVEYLDLSPSILSSHNPTKILYTYNDRKELIKYQATIGKKSVTIDLKYRTIDSKTKQIVKIYNSGSVDTITERYDQNGLLLEKTEISRAGLRALRWIDRYKYDNQGRVSHREHWASDPKIAGSDPCKGNQYMYTYDESKNRTCIQSIAYRQPKIHAQRSDLMPTRQRYENTTDTLSIIITTRNAHDDPTERITKTHNQIQTQVYLYVSDDRGNWITRTEYLNNKPVAIIERQIEYR